MCGARGGEVRSLSTQWRRCQCIYTAAKALIAMNKTRGISRGRTRSTGRGGGDGRGGGCLESPSTSATELSTDKSSSEGTRQHFPSKSVRGEEQTRSRSRKSRLYPPAPPPPPPPLRSRSPSIHMRRKQRRDDSKPRQTMPRTATTRTSSSKERCTSRSSPVQLKSGNRISSRSQSKSRSTNHREGHHDQQQEKHVQQRQQRTIVPGQSSSSGRSQSRAKEKFSYQLDSSDRVGVKSSASTSSTNAQPSATIRSKSSYTARGKSRERMQSVRMTPSPCTRSNLSEQANTTCTTSSSASSGHRVCTRTTTSQSQKRLSASNTGKLDKHGCCIYHPIVQLQRPKSDGRGGWCILSKNCALCIEEAKHTEQRSPFPQCNKGANKERHQLEEDHSMVNTTTAKLQSVVREIAHNMSTGASLDSSPQDGGEEEWSITLSCLESDNDDEPSALSLTSPSSVPMKQGSNKPPAPSSSCYPASDSPSVSAASQKSHKTHASQKSTKSSKSFVSSRRSSSTTIWDEEAKKKGTDVLHRVETALRRIKMLEQMGDGSTATSSNNETSHNHTRTTKSQLANDGLKTAPIRKNSSKTSNVNHAIRTDCNPQPKIDLPNEIPPLELTTYPQIITPASFHSSLAQPSISQSDDFSDLEPGRSKAWMKYATTASARDAADESHGNGRKGSKMKGRPSTNVTNNARKIVWKVKQMPYCDQFGDHGIYTGHVNEDGQPDGSGSMKYENGVFYEGTWTDGCQDAAAQYARIRSGFTSWSGKGKSATKTGMTLPWNARKNDSHDVNEKSNVRGMEWMDFKGRSGRYTGEVNQDKIPHGNGVMRYDFGLIAEGEWVHGVLKEGPHDHLAAATGGGQSVVSGLHRIHSGLSLGSRSVGFPSGAVSTASGACMSVFMPPSIIGVQQFIPSEHAVMAHQNAMLNMFGSAVGSVYGGGVAIPVQQMHYVPMQQQNQGPPVSNIFIS